MQQLYAIGERKPIEIPVDKNEPTLSAPTLPARFQSSIIFDQYALPTNVAQHGQALVVIFTWRISAVIDKDYSIFAHLVDANDKIIAQQDTLLASAGDTVTHWHPMRSYVDAIVLPIEAGTTPGTYRLEIGLYDATTLERLLIEDRSGQPGRDTIVIEPIEVK